MSLQVVNEHRFEFSHDWISMHFPTWERVLPSPESKIKSILEIGCYEGRSTTWFLQRYSSAWLVCFDTFKGALDHQQLGMDFSDVERRFRHNILPWQDSVAVFKQRSQEGLRSLGNEFDIILIDGSHTAPDVLSDLVLSWTLLKKGGVMILDDYGWGMDRPVLETPAPAINAFLDIYNGQFEVLEKGYQVIVRKTV